ncbi:NAD(P)-dependent oxidoreductase [Cryptosporangium phraense]|uniref:NAD(P)-dependent oxidoreductase n=1 Tax=Cryptosporangium phraense TaxID=2593070 RepID=A0A545B017_9ACTN|nr:NAD(P)H-binding protein [Cryptosporangium phraense]TQS46899.1 NAD(P)-dependent oxidoreductase [Cryptosporangium phraense]
MKLAILGATGGVGSALVTQAIERGDDVTAVVRSPERLPAGVRGVRMDFATATGPEPLGPAFAGAHAVLCALGPRSRAEAGVMTSAIRLVLPAMRTADVRRLVVVSAVPVPTVPSPERPDPPSRDPEEGFIMRNVLGPIVRKAFWDSYLDLAEMEDLVRASDRAWTIVRPPRLLNKPLTGRYRTRVGANVRGGRSIPRADVAHFLLATIDRPETVGQTVGIAT